MSIDPRRLLLDMFQAAVDAAAPALCVPAHLPPRPKGRTIVVGGGKAAAAMAAAVEAHWDGPLTGLVVTRYGHAVPCKHVEVIEASHPEPDDAGDHAARRMLQFVAGLSPDDLVIVLLSGGGSALLTSPLDGLARQISDISTSSCSNRGRRSTRSIACAVMSARWRAAGSQPPAIPRKSSAFRSPTFPAMIR